MKSKEEHFKAWKAERQAATIQERLNPQIRQGESFRTRDTELLKGRNPIPTDVNTSYRSPEPNNRRSGQDLGFRPTRKP